MADTLNTDTRGAKNATKRAQPPEPPDGGWAWLVLVGAFLSQALTYGYYGAVAVYVPVWIDFFDSSATESSLIVSLSSFFIGFLSVVAGILITRFSVRSIWMIGGVLASLGLLISALATGTLFLTLSMSLITALGFSVCVNCSLVALGMYFKKRRTVAFGIASSGFAGGQIILTPLVEYLIDQYGWRGSMVIMGGILFHTTACGALVRPLLSKAGKRASKLRLDSETKSADENITNIGGNSQKTNEERDIIAEAQFRISGDYTDTVCRRSSNDDSANFCLNDKEIVLRKHDYDDKDIQTMTGVASEKGSVVNTGSFENPETNDEEDVTVEAHLRTNGDFAEASTELSNNDSSEVFFDGTDISRQKNYDNNKKITSKPTPSIGVEDVFAKADNATRDPCFLEDSGATISPETIHNQKSPTSQTDSNPPSVSRCRLYLTRFRTFMMESYGLSSLFRNPSFVLTIPIGLAHGSGWASVVYHLDAHAESVGLQSTEGATLLTLMGVGAFVGSISHGWFVDKGYIPPLIAFIIALLGDAVTCFILLPLATFGPMAAICVLFGFSNGVVEPLIFVVIQVLVQPSEVAGATSLLLVCWGIGEVLGATIAGWIYDTLASYNIAYVMS
ncbi:monocarboxylate transporter 11-like [Acanthaster planci]|uniref:Monocarboxylate transporter 11-like n=1 Tax=Acanthaster planci TaxID=133434 RepID=A0A8B7YB78_ACAPL|nr:monocarboxylate transporter 11-like [Acanthaster planci]